MTTTKRAVPSARRIPRGTGKAARHASADALDAAIKHYRGAFDDWGTIATWPLESGLAHIAHRLRGGA
jgi:uncharacterized protein YijF (DUF1287 family)